MTDKKRAVGSRIFCLWVPFYLYVIPYVIIFYHIQATSSFEGNIQNCKIVDSIVLKLMEMADNKMLTIASVRDMIEYAAEMGLNVDSLVESNGETLVESVQSARDSPSRLSETGEDNIDVDIRCNMVLQINIVDRNDNVLSEEEENTIEGGGSCNFFANSFLANENYQSSLTDSINREVINSSGRMRASVESNSNSCQPYNTRDKTTRRSNLERGDVESVPEDSGLEFSGDETSDLDGDNFWSKFPNAEVRKTENRIISATPDYASSLREFEHLWPDRGNLHFYSV